MKGLYLKKLRKAQGLSQEALGKMIGVSGAYIQQLETGKKDNPTTDVLNKLSDSLNITVSDLLGFEQSEVDEWNYLLRLLETHNCKVKSATSSDGESTCLDINGVSFVDNEIEIFKNQIFEYIDFLISKQSNKEK